MKLEAKIGTIRITFENEGDLLEKALKHQEALKSQAGQIQEQWDRAEKAYKEKISPIRRNIAALQEAISGLAHKSVSTTS
ncbi:MAG: hypothetical protein ABSH12_07260 [Endomicrobiales bacterium]